VGTVVGVDVSNVFVSCEPANKDFDVLVVGAGTGGRGGGASGGSHGASGGDPGGDRLRGRPDDLRRVTSLDEGDTRDRQDGIYGEFVQR